MFYSTEDGWECEKAENMDKQQALDWLAKHWQMTRYENHHNIKPIHRTMFIHAVEPDEDDSEPEWPKELKSYEGAIYPEAYLCHKFGIERPKDLVESSQYVIRPIGKYPEVETFHTYKDYANR